MKAETWRIKNEFQLETLIKVLKAKFKDKGRLNVICDTADPRTMEQNKLIHVLYREVSMKSDHSTLDARSESKLWCGVPILISEDDDFRMKWNKLIKRKFTIEEKLELMEWFPITSLMNVEQLNHYVDKMVQHWAKQGIYLEV